MESSSPSLRDTILHLILDGVLVWALGKCRGERLFMEFIKFVIELSNHVLDVLTLLFSVELLQDSLLDIRLLAVALLNE